MIWSSSTGKYTPDELAPMASTVIKDLKSGDSRKAKHLIMMLMVRTGLSQEAILAKLQGLTTY